MLETLKATFNLESTYILVVLQVKMVVSRAQLKKKLYFCETVNISTANLIQKGRGILHCLS